MAYLERFPADAVVLDFHMPQKNALELFKELRSRKQDVPVLFLTADTDMAVKIGSLDNGVDDFMSKPISIIELSARLKNRIEFYKKKNSQLIKIKNLEINLRESQVKLAGEPVLLTPKEFELLAMLAERPNVVVEKEELINKLWPNVKVEENNIDTHLSNLRKKLKSFASEIKTIKCVGYVIHHAN
jgi:DNA-binding response OmpR family regulator